MRELKECTAEVFRRSEQRIRERRRKRGRVLALCVPVILIAAVWSAMSLPIMNPEGGALGNDRFTGEAAGNAPESVACPYTAAEIQQAGVIPDEHSKEVTNRLAVAEMFRTVQSLFEDVDSNGIGQNAMDQLPAEEANKNGDLVETPGQLEEYTITFTAEDGSQAVYRLSGHRLLNVNTDEAIFLSDSQLTGLLAALGISE